MDLLSGQIVDNVKEVVRNSNNGLKITCVRWLGWLGTSKLYGSMVVYFIGKKNKKLLISKGLIEIEGETIYTETF